MFLYTTLLNFFTFPSFIRFLPYSSFFSFLSSSNCLFTPSATFHVLPSFSLSRIFLLPLKPFSLFSMNPPFSLFYNQTLPSFIIQETVTLLLSSSLFHSFILSSHFPLSLSFTCIFLLFTLPLSVLPVSLHDFHFFFRS